MKNIRIMIVDDQLIIREGLKKLLEIDENIVVVSEASNGLECMEIIEENRPEVILMDIKMPGINGIETTRLIHQKYPEIKIIILTIYDDAGFVTSAINEGASGYLMKNASRNKIMQCLKHVVDEGSFLDPVVTTSVLDFVKHDKVKSEKRSIALTKREIEVLQSLVSGLIDKQIADKLFISEHTVRSHIKNIYRKMGVSSKAQAAVKAINKGIVSPS